MIEDEEARKRSLGPTTAGWSETGQSCDRASILQQQSRLGRG